MAEIIKDGTGTGNTAKVNAQSEKDVYIKSITIQISDPSARLDRFGALAALTNGVQFAYKSNESGNIIISDSIKTNLDFFRDATGDGKGFGSGSDAFKADISASGADTYFPSLDFSTRFGLHWGLRLRKQTEDKIFFTIRDNLAGLSVFNIKAYGIII